MLRAGARELVTELPAPSSFDAVLDGAVLQGAALPVVRDGGAFVAMVAQHPATAERGIDVHIVTVEPDGAELADLLALTVEGVLELRVAGRVPLADAAAAYREVAGGGQRGRWLLVP